MWLFMFALAVVTTVKPLTRKHSWKKTKTTPSVGESNASLLDKRQHSQNNSTIAAMLEERDAFEKKVVELDARLKEHAELAAMIEERDALQEEIAKLEASPLQSDSQANCNEPAENFKNLVIDCPGNTESGCADGNRKYGDFAGAWAACKAYAGCKFIRKHPDKSEYVLRKSTDLVWVRTGSVPQRYKYMNHVTGATPPAANFKQVTIDCPGNLARGCTLDGNREYATFAEAWTTCGQLQPDCKFIRKHPGGTYYLRKASDLVQVRENAPAYTYMQYSCP